MSRLRKILLFLIGYAAGVCSLLMLNWLQILGLAYPLDQIVPYVVAGISAGLALLGGLGLLPILVDYIKDRREKRREHFKKHIASTLRDWFKPLEVKEISIAHPPSPQGINIDSTELCSVSFREGKVIVQEPQEPEYLDYFNETKKHLEEYPNTINPWTRALNDAKEFTNKTQELLPKIEEALRNIFTEAGFLELNEEPEELKPNMKFWIPWETAWALYNLLLGNDTFRPSSYFSKNGFDYQATEAGKGLPYFVSSNRSEVDSAISKIKQLVPQFKRQIDEINELKTSVKYNLESFKKEKHNLVKYIEADKQIKGKCELCP